MKRPPPSPTLFPYTTLFRSAAFDPELTAVGVAAGCLNLVAIVAAARAVADEALTVKRSEEHTSELQSRPHLVCRLLLEKKNNAESLPNPELPSRQGSRPAAP